MKCEFASYVRDKPYHKNEELSTPFVEIERKVGLSPSKLKAKQSLQCLHSVGLEQDGTVAEYLENRTRHYKNAGKRVYAINFERDVTVDIPCEASDDAIIAASYKECMLYFVEISLELHTFVSKCDETRRPEWVFPKARQNTLKKKTKREHLPFPQSRNTIKISLIKDCNFN